MVQFVQLWRQVDFSSVSSPLAKLLLGPLLLLWCGQAPGPALPLPAGCCFLSVYCCILFPALLFTLVCDSVSSVLVAKYSDPLLVFQMEAIRTAVHTCFAVFCSLSSTALGSCTRGGCACWLLQSPGTRAGRLTADLGLYLKYPKLVIKRQKVGQLWVGFPWVGPPGFPRA